MGVILLQQFSLILPRRDEGADGAGSLKGGVADITINVGRPHMLAVRRGV